MPSSAGLQAAVNQVVSPAVNQQVKIVFGRYTAVKAIQERGTLNTAIKDAITASLKDDPMIMIESVQLENIEFSANYLHSIEQRMLAEVEVQKLQQNAEREKVQAQITVTQANAKANAVRAEAQAAADALRLNGEARATNIKLTGEAEAAAIEARAKALGTNPNLVTPGAGRTLERRAADHDGAGLGGAVRFGEIKFEPSGSGDARDRDLGHHRIGEVDSMRNVISRRGHPARRSPASRRRVQAAESFDGSLGHDQKRLPQHR